jgi:hypothetical protein
MMTLSSEYAEQTSGEDGFQVILGELRFINDMLRYGRRPGANYILPDKITYDLKDVRIDELYTRISQVYIGDGEERPNGKIMKLEFFKYDGSSLIISFIHGYLGTFKNGIIFATPTLDRIKSSFYAFSALVILRCKSVLSQLPQDFFCKAITSTPEFYYMSKDLYGVEYVQDFLQQFMDWGLPFPDYILKTAVDTGDLEYAAALVHEKDALRMKVKEESLRL